MESIIIYGSFSTEMVPFFHILRTIVLQMFG